MSGLVPIGAAATGVAARGVIKKLATRVVAGITGAGAKQVTPVYRNSGSVKVIKSNKLKNTAKDIENQNLHGILSGKTGDPKIIKINSNPTRAR